jgi:hypothetical protein
MDAVMAFWNRLAAMLRPPCDSLSKMAQAGLKARKTCSSKLDNKSAHEREGEKEFSKNERPMRECL